MNRKLSFSLVIGAIIVLISLFVAYVSFNILDSFAETQIQNWKIGGAFAAFIITASLLTSIILQVYDRILKDKTEFLTEQVHELQNKLIRGATCPHGFVIDIDEKHKIVFARPGEWVPRNGMLYAYISNVQNDKFKENFNVIYRSKEDLEALSEFLGLNSANVFSDKVYDIIINYELDLLISSYSAEKIDSMLKEFIFIDGIKSLKATYSYMAKPSNIFLCQSIVLTYVPKFEAVYQFTFSDNMEDYQKTSEIFNNVITSIRFL